MKLQDISLDYAKSASNTLQYIFFNNDYMAIIIDNNPSDHLALKKSTYNDHDNFPTNLRLKQVTDQFLDKRYEEWLKENNLEDKRNENYRMWYYRIVKSFNYIKR
jgi:hypothetical protein